MDLNVDSYIRSNAICHGIHICILKKHSVSHQDCARWVRYFTSFPSMQMHANTFQTRKRNVISSCLVQYNSIDQRERVSDSKRHSFEIRNKCLTMLKKKQFNGHFANALRNSWLGCNRLNCILKFNNNASMCKRHRYT